MEGENNHFQHPVNQNSKKNFNEGDLKVELGKKFKEYLVKSKDDYESEDKKKIRAMIASEDFFAPIRDVTILVKGIEKLTEDELIPEDKRNNLKTNLRLFGVNDLLLYRKSEATDLLGRPQSFENAVVDWVNRLRLLINGLNGIIPEDMVIELQAREVQFLQVILLAIEEQGKEYKQS